MNLRKLMNYRPGRLGQNTLLGTAGLGIRALIQVAYLLMVSRWLGAEGYGLFAGSVALVSLATPLGNWGSALLLTQHIGLDRSRSHAMWATVLVQTAVVGSALILATLLVSRLLLTQQIPLFPLLLLALAELMLLPASHAASSQCYALERGLASAISVCLVPVGRALVMLSAIIGGFTATPEHAAWAHFGGTVLGLGLAFALVTRIDGLPDWRRRMPLATSLKQGTPYAISNAAGTSYQEIDKIVMLQLLGAMIVGSYSAAFRVASIFILPISALISATLPRLMAEKDPGRQKRTYRVMILTGVAYGVMAALCIIVAAPLVPHLFGSGYEDSAYYIKLFAPWPLVFVLRQCLAAKLTATARQRARSVIEALSLVLILLLNWLLLPAWGAQASAWALLFIEVLTATMFWVASNMSQQLHKSV